MNQILILFNYNNYCYNLYNVPYPLWSLDVIGLKLFLTVLLSLVLGLGLLLTAGLTAWDSYRSPEQGNCAPTS